MVCGPGLRTVVVTMLISRGKAQVGLTTKTELTDIGGAVSG